MFYLLHFLFSSLSLAGVSKGFLNPFSQVICGLSAFDFCKCFEFVFLFLRLQLLKTAYLNFLAHLVYLHYGKLASNYLLFGRKTAIAEVGSCRKFPLKKTINRNQTSKLRSFKSSLADSLDCFFVKILMKKCPPAHPIQNYLSTIN
jgi:hypothetical protein